MKHSVEMFLEMTKSDVKPNSVTYACMLSVCSSEELICFGTQIHGHVVSCGLELDSPVANPLLAIFMIEASNCFRDMISALIEPDSITFASFLPSVTEFASLKCRNLEMARKILHQSTTVDLIVCTAMISGFVLNGMNTDVMEIFRWLLKAKNGEPEEAINLFRQMWLEGTKYDCVSISAALHGKEIHGFMIRRAFSSDIFSGSALIDMYAKCGSLDFARRVFNFMEGKNEVPWNSIIAAYGNHGQLEESLTLFREMLEQGILPDHVTFLGIKSACGHAGRVYGGIHFFFV
ncbi:Pentatricopeptide repeat [Trema orientale]|uniref:Pentatricopeptide repeat n=1 Tax=Trema orientale TaxID=63057 RepID=A0A2P5ENS9_TREOI|nr:Pentatricopeptide repeat [Trema orientale]